MIKKKQKKVLMIYFFFSNKFFKKETKLIYFFNILEKKTKMDNSKDLLTLIERNTRITKNIAITFLVLFIIILIICLIVGIVGVILLPQYINNLQNTVQNTMQNTIQNYAKMNQPAKNVVSLPTLPTKKREINVPIVKPKEVKSKKTEIVEKQQMNDIPKAPLSYYKALIV